jgi:NTP pyrophosphatase (non-canonical NTP hydrolase)
MRRSEKKMLTKDDIKNQIVFLIEEELDRSYQKFPAFNSPHEGYAVILEEIEECAEVLDNVTLELEKLWTAVRLNLDGCPDARDIKESARDLVYEAIQVAAMAQKYVDSLE